MPIVLKLRIGGCERLLRGQEHFWQVMRRLSREHGSFSIREIDLASNAPKGAIGRYVRDLVAIGHVQSCGEGRYEIVRDQAATPRIGRRSTGTQAMWNVLRGPLGRDGLTYRDVAAFASTERSPVSPETARAFLRTLFDAGYLVTLGKGKAGNPTVWRLKPAMDTGPMPPMILRSKLVYDQNANKVMGEPLAEEDRP